MVAATAEAQSDGGVAPVPAPASVVRSDASGPQGNTVPAAPGLGAAPLDAGPAAPGRAATPDDAGPAGGAVEPRVQVSPGEPVIRFREPGAAFLWTPPPSVGDCIGGNCGPAAAPPAVPLAAVPRPAARAMGKPHARDPRMRFAYAGAVLGAVSSALVLGGAIAIAAVDDREHEAITRGVWLGYTAVSTPLVALSAHLARSQNAGSSASLATRRIGWTAYAIALTDGAILLAGSIHEFGDLDVLTIGAGAIGVVALLPHALDALVAARGRRATYFSALEPTATGLRLRF